MTFPSRRDAGRELGRRLLDETVRADLVLGLPRGGVIVAAEVARILQLPIDVLVVRKIGHPWQREFAVGAIAEGGVVLLDPALTGPMLSASPALEEIIREETRRLADYERVFHRAQKPELRGIRVLLVDDGLATGSTMQAAALSARQQRAKEVIVAVPVASTTAVERLERVADQVTALLIDPDFDAVGRYYEEFPQTTDDEVIALLGVGDRE